jgi:hypothetical protein
MVVDGAVAVGAVLVGATVVDDATVTVGDVATTVSPDEWPHAVRTAQTTAAHAQARPWDDTRRA